MPRDKSTPSFQSFKNDYKQIITTPIGKPATPPEKINTLRLKRSDVSYLTDELIKDGLKSDKKITYRDNKNHAISVTIKLLSNGHYFAKLSCRSVAKVNNKQLFIKNAVEHAIKTLNLSVSFEEIGVGGVIANEGRWGFLSKLAGAAAHAHTAFKLPNEHQVTIEDPRTGIFNYQEKLQSRWNDQVCCFAASALFYFCYKTLAECDNNCSPCSTKEMYQHIHKSKQVKQLIENVEKAENKIKHRNNITKVGLIQHFCKRISKLENPLMNLSSEHSNTFKNSPL